LAIHALETTLGGSSDPDCLHGTLDAPRPERYGFRVKITYRLGRGKD